MYIATTTAYVTGCIHAVPFQCSMQSKQPCKPLSDLLSKYISVCHVCMALYDNTIDTLDNTIDTLACQQAWMCMAQLNWQGNAHAVACHIICKQACVMVWAYGL